MTSSKGGDCVTWSKLELSPPTVLPPRYGATGEMAGWSLLSPFSACLDFHGFWPGFQWVGGGLSDFILTSLAASSNFFLSMARSFLRERSLRGRRSGEEEEDEPLEEWRRALFFLGDLRDLLSDLDPELLEDFCLRRLSLTGDCDLCLLPRAELDLDPPVLTGDFDFEDDPRFLSGDFDFEGDLTFLNGDLDLDRDLRLHGDRDRFCRTGDLDCFLFCFCLPGDREVDLLGCLRTGEGEDDLLTLDLLVGGELDLFFLSDELGLFLLALLVLSISSSASDEVSSCFFFLPSLETFALSLGELLSDLPLSLVSLDLDLDASFLAEAKATRLNLSISESESEEAFLLLSFALNSISSSDEDADTSRRLGGSTFFTGPPRFIVLFISSSEAESESSWLREVLLIRRPSWRTDLT